MDVPSDDEFRRVAEDVRALAKSLMRDIREGMDQARNESRQASRAMRDELRQAARQSREHFGPDTWGPPPWGWCGPGHRHRSRSRSEAWSPPAQVATRPPRPPKPVKVKEPRPVVRHRRDSSTVLGIVAVVLGLSWLAAGTHLIAIPWRATMAIALMVLGAAMVVTARTDWGLSRRLWPVLLGGGLILALVAGSASLSMPAFGATDVRPVAWAGVTPVRSVFGSTTVDLTSLPPLTADQTLDISHIFGSVSVHLPSGLHVQLDASRVFGTVTFNGSRIVHGASQDVRRDLTPDNAGRVLTLAVHNVFGSVRIDQPPAPASTATQGP